MNNLTMKHLARAMAALIVERRTYEYYGPDLAQRMSLEEMRAKREEIDEAIDALKEAALAALAEHAQPQAAGGVVADWSRADEWANFWTRDDTGRALWWETEPYYDERMGIWMCEDDSRRAQATESPILRQRPQAQD